MDEVLLCLLLCIRWGQKGRKGKGKIASVGEGSLGIYMISMRCWTISVGCICRLSFAENFVCVFFEGPSQGTFSFFLFAKLRKLKMLV